VEGLCSILGIPVNAACRCRTTSPLRLAGAGLLQSLPGWRPPQTFFRRKPPGQRSYRRRLWHTRMVTIGTRLTVTDCVIGGIVLQDMFLWRCPTHRSFRWCSSRTGGDWARRCKFPDRFVHRDSFEFDNLRTSGQKFAFFNNSFKCFFERFTVATAVFCGCRRETETALAPTRGAQLHVFLLVRALGTPAKLIFLKATLDLGYITEHRAVVSAASALFSNIFCTWWLRTGPHLFVEVNSIFEPRWTRATGSYRAFQ